MRKINSENYVYVGVTNIVHSVVLDFFFYVKIEKYLHRRWGKQWKFYMFYENTCNNINVFFLRKLLPTQVHFFYYGSARVLYVAVDPKSTCSFGIFFLNVFFAMPIYCKLHCLNQLPQGKNILISMKQKKQTTKECLLYFTIYFKNCIESGFDS